MADKTRISGNLVSDNNIFVNVSSDNTGIGTTNPQTKLDVVGNVRVSGILSTPNTFYVDTTNRRVGILTTSPVQPFQVGTGSSVVVIDTMGEIGIGTTNPQTSLDVFGNVRISGVITTGTLNVGTGGTIVTTTGIGSVGIGSTRPDGILTVNGPTGNTSNLLQLKNGGVPAFYISTEGYPTIVSGSISQFFRSLRYIGNTDILFYERTSFMGGVAITDYPNGFNTRSDGGFHWSTSNSSISNSAQVSLWSDGNNIIAQRSGTNSQIYRVYNTYTSTTNFERGQIGFTTNTFIVGTEKGTVGGTARSLVLQTDGTTAVSISTTQNVGIGTTTSTEKLSVLGKIEVQQNSGSNNRLILRGQPGSSYRWNIDNYNPTNTFRIYREDDGTSANGYVGLSIDPNGGTIISGITTVGLANTSTPPSNSQMSFELISNTQLRIKVRGTDGILRSTDLTLS